MELFVAVVVSLLAACHGLPTDMNVTSAPCICTEEFMPVCGANGKTYSNQCKMDCEGVQLAHTGACKMCICPFIYAPVCGQDGKTYSNKCDLNCAGVAFFQDGACSAADPSSIQEADVTPPPCACFFIYMPVCGSDGKTYGNICTMNCQVGITKVKDGECDGTTNIVN